MIQQQIVLDHMLGRIVSEASCSSAVKIGEPGTEPTMGELGTPDKYSVPLFFFSLLCCDTNHKGLRFWTETFDLAGNTFRAAIFLLTWFSMLSKVVQTGSLTPLRSNIIKSTDIIASSKALPFTEAPHSLLVVSQFCYLIFFFPFPCFLREPRNLSQGG